MRESREIYLLISIFLYYDYDLTIIRNRSQYGLREIQKCLYVFKNNGIFISYRK